MQNKCLHEWKIVLESGEAQVERCVRCKAKNVTRFDSRGRHDLQEYVKTHERDFMQRSDKRYASVYASTKR